LFILAVIRLDDLAGGGDKGVVETDIALSLKHDGKDGVKILEEIIFVDLGEVEIAALDKARYGIGDILLEQDFGNKIEKCFLFHKIYFV
jgi:hypothetical protein